MKPEAWRRVETLFHQALEVDDNKREAFLRTACEGDSDLLQEVQALLDSYRNRGSFMEKSAFARGLEALGARNATLLEQKLGRYEIIKLIGTGGMGEVYLAHDSLLDRFVALKLLPTVLTNDPQRVRRFQQEAHAASTISHPNIAHIYEIGAHGDYKFTSMEYVEGRTLREVLNEDRLSVAEALDIAVQVARALESAHAAGVIHRDIKPENIMIRPDGYVKVLDFGIAKLERMPDANDPRCTRVATLIHTEPGLIVGSPAYMSPEQARGVEVDARTDIWSLGIVLYEMLCGWTPFQGSTNIDVIAALLRDEPAPIAVPLRHAHPRLRKLLNRMLSKDKDQRYLTSAEVVKDLQNFIRDLRWSTKKFGEASLFQGTRLAFLKHKTLEIYRAREGTVFRTPLPFFIMTIIVGVGLNWYVRNFVRPWIITPNPEVEKHYHQGVEAIFRDDFYIAAIKLNSATKELHTQSMMAHARFAEVWAELDYAERANYELSELAKLEPVMNHYAPLTDTESLYIRAANAIVARDFRYAMSLYRAVVEKEPGNAVAWMDLGRSYERLRWWDEAAHCYREASRKAPSLASAFLRLGAVEIAKNNEREAIAALDQASRLYSITNNSAGLGEVLNQRITLAYKLGRQEEAENLELQETRNGYGSPIREIQRQFLLAQMNHADVQKAEGLIREARKMSDQIGRVGLLFRGPDQLLVNGLLDLGLSYLRANDLINARLYISEALRIARRSDLKIGKAKVAYAHAQQRLHEGFPEQADEELKIVLRIEMPRSNFSDKTIAMWRNTLFDRDYDEVLAEFKTNHDDSHGFISTTR